MYCFVCVSSHVTNYWPGNVTNGAFVSFLFHTLVCYMERVFSPHVTNFCFVGFVFHGFGFFPVRHFRCGRVGRPQDALGAPQTAQEAPQVDPRRPQEDKKKGAASKARMLSIERPMVT